MSTPVSTPVATPVSAPVNTPASTPVSTPVNSPVSAPVDTSVSIPVRIQRFPPPSPEPPHHSQRGCIGIYKYVLFVLFYGLRDTHIHNNIMHKYYSTLRMMQQLHPATFS